MIRRPRGAPPVAWPRLGLAVAWGGVVLSLALAPWIREAPAGWWLAPWAASVVVLGLPHGALDPLVPFRMLPAEPRAGRLAAFCVAYLALAALVVAVWAAAPAAAAVGFVVLTWAHWGQGDVFALRAYGWDGHLPTRAHLALAGVVRGALPMAVPLAAQPDAYADVLASLAGLFAPDAAADARALAVGAAAPVRVALGVLLSAYAVLGGVAAWRRRAWRAFTLDAAEVGALTAFFAWLPPLWSVGVYFCLWHALRHLARLEPVVAPRRPGRLALLAAPATLGVLALFAGLGWALAGRPEPPEWLAVYLVGIAAVTVPHVAVVVWMDARQRVWSPGH